MHWEINAFFRHAQQNAHSVQQVIIDKYAALSAMASCVRWHPFFGTRMSIVVA
jgi:hypothetical protein